MTLGKEQSMSPTFVIGDLHGQLEKTLGLLRTAGLIDASHRWSGADATLCFLGDYCDRGPEGIGCVDLVMRLQGEASAAGGRTIALLGNHEPLLLSAHRFVHSREAIWASFWTNWKRNGGVDQDLAGLTPEHVDWISTLPAMVHLGRHLLAHADAVFYIDYGDTVSSVNGRIAQVLTSDDLRQWDQLLTVFTERLAFFPQQTMGASLAALFLQTFGGEQLIHGHTPISYMLGQSAATIYEALIYADGLCVNVDGGMYQGGPGFVYELT
jgi:hypothetical protein